MPRVYIEIETKNYEIIEQILKAIKELITVNTEIAIEIDIFPDD